MTIVHQPINAPGNQPVRVLQHNLTSMLEKVDGKFLTDVLGWIKTSGLQPGIEYDARRLPIINRLPDGTVETRAAFATQTHQIGFSESFLSYVWCNAYATMVLLNDRNIKPALGRSDPTDPVIAARIAGAQQLFNFGLRLRDNYLAWPLSLPNPQSYDEKEKRPVEEANAVFLYAMIFVLLHEIAHVALGHTAELGKKIYVSKFDRKAQEQACDQWAVDRGFAIVRNDGLDETRRAGLVVGLFSLLLLSPGLSGGDSHPDPDERIVDGLHTLALKENDYAWFVAVQGLVLWQDYYHRPVSWPSTGVNAKEVFLAAMASVAASKTI
jgi:hypothetical protein